MADSYHIIDGQVVPFHGGRKDTNTGAWRDATPLELQLQEQLAAAEEALAEAAAALEAAREDAERYRWLRDEARTNRVPHIFQYPPQSFDRPQYPHFKDVGLDAAIDAAREARNG